MYPVLFQLGPFSFYTFGLCYAIGFLVCVSLLRRLVQRDRQIHPDQIADYAFWGLMFAILGARLLYVMTQWPYFVDHPLSIFKLWDGGLVFFGGLLLNVLAFFFFFRNSPFSFWKLADMGVIGYTAGHAFGRLGCFFAGCCHGKPAPEGWGIRFYSELIEPQMRGIPLYPTQLYEAAVALLLFGFFWFRYWKREKPWDGQIFLSYLMLYSFFRFFIEIIRGDDDRAFLLSGMLSTSQFISIGLILGGALVFGWRRTQVLKR